MDIVTYAILNKKIAGMMPDYKGVVTSTTDLPEDASQGDMYVVTGEGNIHYYFDGSDWSAIDPNIATNTDIDGLYS